MAAKVVLYCNGPLPLQGNADQDGAIVLQCKKIVLQCEEKLEGGRGGKELKPTKAPNLFIFCLTTFTFPWGPTESR